MRRKKEIAKNYLREYRLCMKPKMTLEKLAELAEEHWQNIGRYEKMERSLEMAMANKLAPHLGLSSGAMLFSPPNENSKPDASISAPSKLNKNKRSEVFEALEKWEEWSEGQQEEFLAIALMHRKKKG